MVRNIQIDNVLRAFRLARECSFYCKSIDFLLTSDSNSIRYHASIPIKEPFRPSILSTFHCERGHESALINELNKISFPFDNKTLNTAHRFYDLSYHVENYIVLTLLIVALEMLYLVEPDGKKARLSKRCSVFTYNTKADRVVCEKRLINAYRQRSTFVHNGEFIDISNETILFLRHCVRKVLISFMNKPYDKKSFISSLKDEVDKIDYWEE